MLIQFVCSCTNTKEKNERELKIKRKEIRDKIKSQITEKYDIKYKWDTLEYIYSISYKPVIETKLQMIDEFRVHDIYMKAVDSSYHIFLRTYSYPPFYFDLKTDLENLNKLIGDFSQTRRYESIYSDLFDDIPDKILIVKISNIQKLKFEVSSDIESDDYGVSSEILIDESRCFYGKGKIVDIISIDN